MSLITAATAVNFLAINCSDFDSASYPVELALSLANGKQYHAWVKPLEGYSIAELPSDLTSTVARFGKSANEVCVELNELCGGKTLHCDHWGLTASWMDNLYLASNVSRDFRCSPIESFLEEDEKLNWNARKQFVIDILRSDDYSTVAQVEVMQAVVNLFYREQASFLTSAKRDLELVLQ